MSRTKHKQATTVPCLFLDSGAPTLYNRFARKQATDDNNRHKYMGAYLKDRRHDDYSFVQSDEYKAYLAQYIAFIKEHESVLEVYANLDIINNPELTWQNQQLLEAEGLHPLPVYHFGTDVKWLRMYLDMGYDYIAIGGMVPNPAKTLIPALDRLWTDLLTDAQGMPVVKVHGFAATSLWLMTRYPWYSVDSSSWIKYAGYGIILYPRWQHGRYRYDQPPLKIAVSTRSGESQKGRHFTKMPPLERKHFDAYVNAHGFAIGRSTFRVDVPDYKPPDENKELVYKRTETEALVEVIEERGISNWLDDRVELDGYYYMELERRLPQWPWAFKPHSIRRRRLLG